MEHVFVWKVGARLFMNLNSEKRGQMGGDIHSMVECKLFAYGIRIGGVKMISRTWPSRKSEPQSDISTILTMNSRAGCDMAELPNPRPYHLPVHHARFVSSCLNSRVKKTAIRIFWTVRCMAMIAITPRTACEASQSSRNHYNTLCQQ